MQYLIGKFRIGAPVGGKITWEKNLKFFDHLTENMIDDSECIIVGRLFEYDTNPSATDFMLAFNILLKLQSKSNVKMHLEVDENSYTYNIAKILGINIEKDSDLYREGIETKKIGNTYSVACPYYLDGEKRKSKFGYFEGKDGNFEFIENPFSSKVIEVKITPETDIKELKKVTEEKKDDLISIELDKKILKEMHDEEQTDLILLLNQDNVKVEKKRESLDLSSVEEIDFTPDKNFYIKLLISIIQNKGMSDPKKKAYLKTLKEISS
jgi:hypothetical protein